MLYATEFRDDRQHHVETETCIIFNIEGVLTELTSLEGRVGLRDVPRHGGEQRDAMLRGGDGVCGGRVDDEAAVLGGGGEVDVVDPDPRAADDAEPAPGGLEDVAADLGPGPDDERVAERDLGAELLGGEAVGAVDVGELAQQREPRGAELLGDEHRGLPRDGPRGRRLGGRGGGRGRRGGVLRRHERGGAAGGRGRVGRRSEAVRDAREAVGALGRTDRRRGSVRARRKDGRRGGAVAGRHHGGDGGVRGVRAGRVRPHLWNRPLRLQEVKKLSSS